MKKFIVSILVFFTLSYLSFTQSYTRELKLKSKRMNGNDVLLLQKMLLSLGFEEVGDADGWLGPKTENAIKEFQQYAGFEPNGVFGKQEFDFLYNGTYLNQQFFNAIKVHNKLTRANLSNSEEFYDKIRASEGAGIITYRDGKQKVKAAVSVCGSMGKIDFIMIPSIGSDYLFLDIETKYKGFMGEGGIADIITTPFFYCDDTFYKIENGKFLSTFDFDENYSDIITDLRRILF